ncbi:hypothetical protein BKI52_24890 [marine bacterium AO1-C]|nr:hypothetical protein BKI52_24890 [marine bacterium AO1-C]
MNSTHTRSNLFKIITLAFFITVSFNGFAQYYQGMTEQEKAELQAKAEADEKKRQEQAAKEQAETIRVGGLLALGLISFICLFIFLNMRKVKKNSWGKVEVKQRPIKGYADGMGQSGNGGYGGSDMHL